LEVIEGEEDSFWKLEAGRWGVQEHAEIEWDSGGRAENLEKRA